MLGFNSIGTAISVDSTVYTYNPYNITVTTNTPLCSITINRHYDITTTSTLPAITIVGDLEQFISIETATKLPSINIEILQERHINIVSTTAVPSVTMTLVAASLYDVTATSNQPTLLVNLDSEYLYSITARTSIPSIEFSLSIDNALNITATTNKPVVSLTYLQSLVYAITTTTALPRLLVRISAPSATITAGDTTAWCVNMSTGAHSRYTNYPDANSTSTIPAFILSPCMDFGTAKEKFLHDIYVYCRLADESITFDTITDEWVERTGYEIAPNDDVKSIVRRRVKTAKGIRGSNWQIRMNNVNSGNFVVREIDLASEESSRRI